MVRRNQRPGDDDYYDVSFSGLKTAVLNAVRGSENIERDAPHIARGFQDALIETLAEKVRRAVEQHERHRVVLGGGVACNQALVGEIRKRVADLGAEVYAPSVRLATDNAAMIARAGLFHAERGRRDDWSLNAYASKPLGR
jgi:N6-L-threonylcarbamoyladenine synthase